MQSKIIDNLSCIICLENAKDAVQCTNCQNLFCDPCDKGLKQRDCPMCRINNFQTKPSMLARKMMSQILNNCNMQQKDVEILSKENQQLKQEKDQLLAMLNEKNQLSYEQKIIIQRMTQEHQEQKQTFEDQISTKNQELEHSAQFLNELLELIQEKEKQNIEAKKVNQTLEQKVTQLNQEIETSNSLNFMIHKELQEITQQNQDLKQKIIDSDHVITDLTQQLESKQNDEKKIQQDFQEEQSTILMINEETEKYCKQQDQEFEGLRKYYQDLEAKNNMLTEAYTQLAEENEKLKEQSSQFLKNGDREENKQYEGVINQ